MEREQGEQSSGNRGKSGADARVEHGPSLEFLVFGFFLQLDQSVIDESRVAARPHAVADRHDEFGQDEGVKRIGEGIDRDPDRKGESAEDQGFLPSDDIGQVAGRNLEYQDREGV